MGSTQASNSWVARALQVPTNGRVRDSLKPGTLRICHVASGDLWAGAEVQTAQLLSELKKDSSLDLAAIVLNKGVLHDRLASIGINTQLVDESVLNPLEIARRLYQFNKRWRPNVVHTHRYKENVLGGLAAAWSNVPVIVHTVHGLQEAFQGWEHVKLKCHALIANQVTRMVASGLIGVSQEIESHLRREFPHIRVSCIRNGITGVTPGGVNMPGPTRKSIGIEESAFVLGSIGRLTTIKGIEYLLRAVALLVKERKLMPIHVAVIGGGPLQKSLETLSAELSITEHVRFLGERQDVPNLLRLLDVFVIPSLHEGIPMALLEAMRAGCPVIASAVGGIPEVIRDGKDGVLVPPRDPGALARAIELLYASVQDRMRLSHAGRARVEAEFDAERMAELTKEFYRTLLGQQR